MTAYVEKPEVSPSRSNYYFLSEKGLQYSIFSDTLASFEMKEMHSQEAKLVCVTPMGLVSEAKKRLVMLKLVYLQVVQSFQMLRPQSSSKAASLFFSLAVCLLSVWVLRMLQNTIPQALSQAQLP